MAAPRWLLLLLRRRLLLLLAPPGQLFGLLMSGA
jgi:hypothetical protein